MSSSLSSSQPNTSASCEQRRSSVTRSNLLMHFQGLDVAVCYSARWRNQCTSSAAVYFPDSRSSTGLLSLQTRGNSTATATDSGKPTGDAVTAFHTNNTMTHKTHSPPPSTAPPTFPLHHITGLQYFTLQICKQCQSYTHTWQHKYAGQ